MEEKKEELSQDEKIEQFIQKETEKEITQEDKIDPKVDDHINEMGWLFNASRAKIEKDKTCFGCKRDIDLGNEKIYLAEAGNTEKGVFALVSLCEECFTEMQKKQQENKVGK